MGIPKIGTKPLQERLWLPQGQPHQSGHALGIFRQTRQFEVMAQTTPDRQVQKVLLVMRSEGAAYCVDSSRQLREIIDKLQQIYDHWVSKGQSRLVSLDNRGE